MDTSEKDQAQAQMLANRVKKRFKHLSKRFAKQNLQVFRLYDWDIPEIRAVVDWYAGHLVVGEYTREQSTPGWLSLIGEAVAQALEVPRANLHLKIRKAGIKDGERYQRINTKNKKIPMWERDLQFLVNPSDYVDTGLFSDHRQTRMMVRKMVRGKDFLNLYCYTGAFTCYAAKGGAASSLSVDRSETAITWVKENLALNNLSAPCHTQLQRDTFDFLKKALRLKHRYDIAVVDPPSYSTTRMENKHFDIAKDYPLLLNQVFKIMRPASTVFFSTNHQSFCMAEDQLDAAEIKEITRETIPEDYVSKKKQIHRCWRISV